MASASFSFTPRDKPLVPELHLICGPMFAGKTEEMLRMQERYQHAGRSCVLVKPTVDVRAKDRGIKLHNGKVVKAHYETDLLVPIVDVLKNYEVVCVDEAQFFPDLVDACKDLVEVHGRVVLLAALNGTFERKPFSVISDVIPLCTSVQTLDAICTGCGSIARFSKRINSTSSDTILIGGSEVYQPVCRWCYIHE